MTPEKVKEMRTLFLAEAKKFQVLPLDASVGARHLGEAQSHAAIMATAKGL